MKKIFYIVLTIVVLLVIGRLVKQEMTTPQPEEEIVVVEEGIHHNDVIGDGEIIDEEAENVIETNPEETANEDETIIAE